MKLLNIYEDRDDAENAAKKLIGDKRVASERDDTTTIYNLFGVPSWGNFHRLQMHNLDELQHLLTRKSSWTDEDREKHKNILIALSVVAKNNQLEIPSHWLS
ncbi:hypothetical protein IPC692_11950 [Pseudomonas aeruginosa]|uniref:hypothetical protein n=1 Tax=Pseudomonas aeruginosa TaxID=287 RepID=UPI000F52C012|nr:hypothetical protein [Pseudomonas aeruginosa]MDA3276323.1 hypothetical protein [Pseudomonas aeruginosa]RPY41081.1 hypothetical protein IPC692_11950 [Pseudomonas aeruginosa]RPY51060.1 hypothetical protein IPC688_09295 [Pseudomonas aeruginosa]WCV92966.1 hypothetical protein KK172_11430 [Pseudomonas aeruginosa]WCV98612.1 hypothetical protein KK197_11430 [Pseudomonas aeruginosa]